MRRLALITVSLLVMPLGSLRAQESADAALATVQALFDAMRAGDTASMRPLFEDDARLVMTFNNQEGEPETRVATLDGFVQNVGAADGVIDEQIWDVEVRVEDNLATVWNKYALYYQGQLHHCGVDSFQLAHTMQGWKIIAIADTQRRQGCEDAPGM
jgi:hypothetical protein